MPDDPQSGERPRALKEMAPHRAPSDRFCAFCSLIAAAIGAITAFRWLAGFEGMNGAANHIPMAPSTATGFLLLGFAMITRSRRGIVRLLSSVCAAAVGLFACAKLIEFWVGVNLRVDEIFVAHPAAFGAVKKARMAPLTAVVFLLSTLALGCLSFRRSRRFAGFLSVLVTVSSVVVLLGYGYGTPLLYGGSIIPVAFPTALAFLFTGCSLIAATGTGRWPLSSFSNSSARSVLMLWFLPVVILGTIVNGYIQTLFLKRPGYNPAVVSAVSTLSFALLISAIISKVSQVIGGRLDKAEADRNAAQESLKSLNEGLEMLVVARTLELRSKNEELQKALTDLTRTHEALKSAQLQLIQAEKMQSVGSLAAGVAHEVKNPLAIIEMGLGCLETQPGLDPETRATVHREMQAAVSRANSIISGLLAYSSSKDLDIRGCRLDELLDHSLLLMKHEFVNRQISIVREWPLDLPACRVDAQKVEQVFINLFTNACHAMPNGGVLALEMESRVLGAGEAGWNAGDRSGRNFLEGEQVVVVSISDTGTGIPSEQIARIFDPFFTTKPTGEGTGLGLTVSRKIIDLHGGRLEVANSQQGGAIAKVIFRAQ